MKKLLVLLLVLALSFIQLVSCEDETPIFQSAFAITETSGGKVTHLSTSLDDKTYFVSKNNEGVITIGQVHPDGIKWSVKTTPSKKSLVLDLSSSENGAVAVVRHFEEITICDKVFSFSTGLVNLIVVKLNPSGECQWTNTLSFTSSVDEDKSHSLTLATAISSQGVVYISSSFNGHLMYQSADVDNSEESLESIPFLLTIYEDGKFKYFQRDIVLSTNPETKSEEGRHCPQTTCKYMDHTLTLKPSLNSETFKVEAGGKNLQVLCSNGVHFVEGSECQKVQKRSEEKTIYMPTKMAIVETETGKFSIFMCVDIKRPDTYLFSIMRRNLDEDGKSHHKFSFGIQNKPEPAHGSIFVSPYSNRNSGIFFTAKSAEKGGQFSILVGKLSFLGDLLWASQINNIGPLDPLVVPAAPISGTCGNECKIYVAGPSTNITKAVSDANEKDIDVWPRHHGFITSIKDDGSVEWVKEVFQNAESGQIFALSSFAENVYVGGHVSGKNLRFNWVGGFDAELPSPFISILSPPQESPEDVYFIEIDKIPQVIGFWPISAFTLLLIIAFAYIRRVRLARKTHELIPMS